MRTSTSFATFVALVAVAGSAAPIGAPGSSSGAVARAHGPQRARSVVPESTLKPTQDTYAVGVPDLTCGDCRDQTIKAVSLDGAKPLVDTVKDVVDVDGKGVRVPGIGESSDGLLPVHASVDIGDDDNAHHDGRPEEHQHPAQQPPAQQSHDEQTSGQSSHSDSQHQHAEDEPPHNNNSGTNPEVKSESEVGATEVKVNSSKDHVDSNISVDIPEDGKSEVPCPDEIQQVEVDIKDVHDRTMTGAKEVVQDAAEDVNDIHNHVQAGLGSVNKDLQDSGDKLGDATKADVGVTVDSHQTPEQAVGAAKDVGEQVVGDMRKQSIVTVSQKPGSDNPEDCEDLATVDSHGGETVASIPAVRRFTSRILPRGWFA